MGKRTAMYAADAGDRTWLLSRPCDVCGLDVYYNNFPDKRGRQKRYIFRGFFLCPRCDPRAFIFGGNGRHNDKRISNRRLYRVILALQLVRRLAQETCTDLDDVLSQPCGKCGSCLARRIEKVC